MSEYYKDKHRYDDMLDLPHYQSSGRSHMSLHDRAAQFAPFAALTGHEEAIEETARLTLDKVVLTETESARINQSLTYVETHLSERIRIAVTYFKKDLLKNGGAYLTDVGFIRKIDSIEQFIVMDSGVRIMMDEIMDIRI